MFWAVWVREKMIRENIIISLFNANRASGGWAEPNVKSTESSSIRFFRGRDFNSFVMIKAVQVQENENEGGNNMQCQQSAA